MIQEIEKELKLGLPPELRDLYQLIEDKVTNGIKLDMRGTNKHWFLNYEYNLLLLYSNNSKKLFTRINEKINSYQYEWGWRNRKLLVFAETQKIVDGGGFLFYAFDADDNLLGLYCTALGWVQEVVLVASSLSDFFEIPKNDETLKKQDASSVLILKPEKKKYFVDYTKLVNKNSYITIDAEFGLVMNLSVYKSFIDKTLIPLSKGKLFYNQLTDLSENSEILRLQWIIGEEKWEVKLDAERDYLDIKIFPFLNKILKDLKMEERFIPFQEVGQGQEFTLGFFNKSEQEKMNMVSNINFLKY